MLLVLFSVASSLPVLLFLCRRQRQMCLRYSHASSSAASDVYQRQPQTMRHDLIERCVPVSIITMDGQCYRTLLSMRNIKQHFRVNDMIIISQKWHNERSIFLADKMKIKAVGYNADDVRHPRAIWTHIRELLTRVKLFIDLYVTHRKDFCE